MRLLFFLLVLPSLVFSQIEVIKIAPQPNVFEHQYGVVIEQGWPKENIDSWYGDPDVSGLSHTQTSNVWFSTTLGPRMFYTNITENQRIFRGDTIRLAAGGGTTYKWSTGETTRIIKVAPTETTTYSVTMEDDIQYSPDRRKTLSVTVFVEDKILQNQDYINIGNDITICEGESIQLKSNFIGTSNTTYVWSNGETTDTITITPTMTQTYSVEVTDGETILTDYILIIVKKCLK